MDRRLLGAMAIAVAGWGTTGQVAGAGAPLEPGSGSVGDPVGDVATGEGDVLEATVDQNDSPTIVFGVSTKTFEDPQTSDDWAEPGARIDFFIDTVAGGGAELKASVTRVGNSLVGTVSDAVTEQKVCDAIASFVPGLKTIVVSFDAGACLGNVPEFGWWAEYTIAGETDRAPDDGAADSVANLTYENVTCDGQLATIVGTAGPDTIEGTPGDDVIVAKGGNDDVDGKGGNDVICLGGGADDATGGRGADLIIGGSGGDDISGGPGADEIVGGGGLDELSGGGGADEITGGIGNDEIEGGPGSDDLAGNGGADDIDGGGQNDEIDGGGGADDIAGGRGADTVDGRGGADDVNGNGGADTLRGQAGSDELVGATGSDSLFGGPGNDTLKGGLGNDSCDGGPGRDEGPGCDTLDRIP